MNRDVRFRRLDPRLGAEFPLPAPATSLAAMRSTPLRASLSRACASTSCVSAANPTTTRGRDGCAATAARMSGVRTSSSTSVSPVFLIFCGAARDGV